MATIDYKQKIKDYMNSSEVDTLYKSMLNNLFPELAESEDERKRKSLIDMLKNDEKHYLKEIAWLEKQCEKGTNGNNMEIPNSDWSEEDESRIDNLCHFLEEYGNQYYGHLTLQCTISWLKSFKDRRTWKPSESDIRILEQVIDGTANPINYHATLHAILEKLKKLREE